MSKQVPQEVYGLKGGTEDFDAHEEEHEKSEKKHSHKEEKGHSGGLSREMRHMLGMK